MVRPIDIPIFNLPFFHQREEFDRELDVIREDFPLSEDSEDEELTSRITAYEEQIRAEDRTIMQLSRELDALAISHRKLKKNYKQLKADYNQAAKRISLVVCGLFTLLLITYSPKS